MITIKSSPRPVIGACAGKERIGAFTAVLATGLLLFSGSAWSKALTDVTYTSLAGNRVVVNLTLDEAAEAPKAFTINDPARIAIDLPGTTNRLGKKQVDIGIGAVEGVSAAEAGGRTRVVVKLAQMVPYELQTSGNVVRIVLEQPSVAQAPSTSPIASATAPSAPAAGQTGYSLANVDFRRTVDGAGRVVVKLSDPSLPVTIRQEGGKIIADFMNSQLDPRLERRLDVTDFATPVQTIDTRRIGSTVRMTITPSGIFDQIAYQTNDLFTIEVKPLTQEEEDRRRTDEERYKGDRLSLNFQDIEVRAVLQLIADFTGLNVVVSDTVKGNVTLRLQEVPWDQALEIVLRTKGLDKRQRGNVILVAPADELANRDKVQLESQKQVRELAPLRTEFIQINFAKAADLAGMLSTKDSSLLSDRGNARVDSRTNTLIIQDTDAHLSDIRTLVTRLDVPVQQVLIESRVVIASDEFARDLGVRFGYSRHQRRGNQNGGDVWTGGTQPGNLEPTTITGFEIPDDKEGLMVDLPANLAGASLGLAVGKLGSYLLQLELSAMETEGRGSIVSSPKVITTNQKAATIEQGIEIPYYTISDEGAKVEFKKAVLGLTVTPQITPDDRVMMDLKVSKDSRGPDVASGSGAGSMPTINTQSVETQVLVSNGETVVLGGVYEQTTTSSMRRVPLLGDIPVVGHLFRSKASMDDRRELLIFVTPKILKDALRAN